MNYSFLYSPFSNSVLSSFILLTSTPKGLVLLHSKKSLVRVPVYLQCYPGLLHEWGLGLGFYFLSANWMWKQDTMHSEKQIACWPFQGMYIHICDRLCVTVRPAPAWMRPGGFHRCPTEIQLHKDAVSQCGYLGTEFWHFHSPLPKCMQCWFFFFLLHFVC